MFVVVLLGLALAANSVMFSVADSLVFSPTPFADSERIVTVTGSAKAPDRLNLAASAVVLQRWNEQSDVVAAAGGALQKNVFLQSEGAIEKIDTYDITVRFLDVLGASPRWGRGFRDDDIRDQGAYAVILAEDLARRRFGSPERALGQRIEATAGPHVVVGVMDRSFIYPTARFQMWRALDPTGPLTRNFGGIGLMMRLSPSVPLERLDAMVRERAAAVGSAAGLPSYAVTTRPVFGEAPAARRTFVLVLVAAALCLLLAACASVASIELAGATRRARTMAVHLALGASRGTLTRIAAMEGGLIILAALLVAALLTWLGTDLAARNLPATLTLRAYRPIDFDLRALLAMIALASAAWAAATASPMLAAWRSKLLPLLKAEDRGASASRRAVVIRRLLTASQVAVAVALVIGALLFSRTYTNLISVDKGFDSQRLFSLGWSLPANAPTSTLQARAIEVLKGSSAVEAVTTSAPPPSTGDSPGPAAIRIDGGAPAEPPARLGRKWIDADYFKVISLPLKAGRLPQLGDSPDDVVVPERFARKFFPNGAAVGHTFQVSEREPVLRVIGVVGDFRIGRTRMPEDGDNELYYYFIPPPPAVQRAAAQSAAFADSGGSFRTLRLTVRMAPGASAETLRQLAQQIAPEFQAAITDVDETYAALAADTRLSANVVSVFGWFAFGLAMAGVFGVMTFVVAGRTREIGIRVALGADRQNIRSLILGSSLQMVGAGAIAGVAVAAVASRWIEAQMFGVSATDPMTYAVATGAAVAVSLLASWLPARQAAAVDPAVTLRAD